MKINDQEATTVKRSGNYRAVKICINEIEAMKKLGFSRQTILDHLISYFKVKMTLKQLTSNTYHAQKEVEADPDNFQTHKDKVSELIKLPELIQKNFRTYQLIIKPEANGIETIIDRRITAPLPAPTQAIKSADRSAVSTTQPTKPTIITAKPEVDVLDSSPISTNQKIKYTSDAPAHVDAMFKKLRASGGVSGGWTNSRTIFTLNYINEHYDHLAELLDTKKSDDWYSELKKVVESQPQ
jgi:hypothetical protein